MDGGADSGFPAAESVQETADAFQTSLAELLEGRRRLALAVSGGSDSVALLLLAIRCRGALGLELICATVDHQLRSEARAEAEGVAALCARYDIPHSVLTWSDQKPPGNLQAAARDARARLLRAWRRRLQTPVLALGHTQDDAAETLLMRLARGSGVDGLARMARRRLDREPEAVGSGAEEEPLQVIRPMLELRREALRDVCRAAGESWIEDPSNQDPQFLRSRARQALTALAPLGLSVERLSRTAVVLQRAREALERSTDALLSDAAQVDGDFGAAVLKLESFAAAPRELALRGLARVLEWVGAAAYPPRLEALEAALDAVLAGDEKRSLHGALLEPIGERRCVVCREPAAMAAPTRIPTDCGSLVWDNRFCLRIEPATEQDWGQGAIFGALGEQGRLAIEAMFGEQGVEAPARWRSAPLDVRRAAPALFDAAGRVILAPTAEILRQDAQISLLRAPPWKFQAVDRFKSVER